MKKLWFSGILLVVPLAVVGLTGCTSAVPAVLAPGLVGAHNASADITATSQQAIISVNGNGTVTVSPDVANINLGVQVQETTVAAAQASAATAMSQIMAVLKANNIADTDIETTQFNIYPVYNYSKTSENNISGYTVSNIVNVKIRNLDNVGKVIDDVAAAGGNLTVINNIYFSVDDPSEYYSQARELAMNDAKAKAEQLATLGGVTLGKPVYITESSSAPSQVYNATRDSAGVVAPTTSISAGNTDIVLSVQVSYSIS